MTSAGTNQPIVTAAQYAGYAADAADKLNTFIQSAQDMRDAGRTLNVIQKFFVDMNFMTKVNIGMQLVSMGFVAVEALMGVKGTEEQILDRITEIGGQISGLQVQIANLLPQIKLVVDLSGAKNALETIGIPTIERGMSYIDTIAKNKKAGQSNDYMNRQLAAIDTGKIGDAVQAIHDYTLNPDPSQNILQTLYQQSYGNLDAVRQMGQYLTQMAQAAVVVDGAAEAAAAKLANPAFSEDDAAKLAKNVAEKYGNLPGEIAAAALSWNEKCIQTDSIAANVKRYVDENKVQIQIDADSYQGTSDRLIAALTSNWDYLNFTVLAYPPVLGYDHHGMIYSTAVAMFQFQDPNGKKLNLVIDWAPRQTKTRPQLKKFGDASLDQYHVANQAPLNTLFNVLNAQINSTFGLFNKVAKDTRPFLQSYVDQESPLNHSLEGGMIWAAYISLPGLGDPVSLAEFPLGVSTYNRAFFRCANVPDLGQYLYGECYVCGRIWAD